MQNLLVIGGNGFVGSAVCKQAIAQGWRVSSLSRSGKPYTSAKGHQPAWSSRVGSAFDVTTYGHLLATSTTVVHTLGILLEGDYKSGATSFMKTVGQRLSPSFLFSGPNPLSPENSQQGGQYERVNRDSALAVFKAYQETRSAKDGKFIYISAEDVFRPFIPTRYIATKRQAERELAAMARNSKVDNPIEPYFMRPSLIYHPHSRPVSTLPATLLDLSAGIQARLPPILQVKTGAAALQALSFLTKSRQSDGIAEMPPATESMANLLSIPPIHVDTVAEAVCKVANLNSNEAPIDRVFGVKEMRDLVGWNTPRDSDTVNSLDSTSQPPPEIFR